MAAVVRGILEVKMWEEAKFYIFCLGKAKDFPGRMWKIVLCLVIALSLVPADADSNNLFIKSSSIDVA